MVKPEFVYIRSRFLLLIKGPVFYIYNNNPYKSNLISAEKRRKYSKKDTKDILLTKINEMLNV